MQLPAIREKISFRPSRLSSRFFIYFLFGLIILVLAVEGGYYFWIQKRAERQQVENPVINRVEGVFTYINSTEGTVEKMILGTIEKIDGNLLTIKTSNNKTVQVLFTGEGPFIASLIFDRQDEVTGGDLKLGTMADLLIGDEVRVAEIDSEDKAQISAKSLIIVRLSGK